ncbi:hypothetical protein XELAEV_18015097mg [Xenopus laevis]|uniref:PH domain-containing protein n=1 Tax=Xenopus laevis TaxID=8355 RepID=A0A974DJ12_XENLA|nr:hypothetical protein XELAEV_18015097mg [Xenopus laevis]
MPIVGLGTWKIDRPPAKIKLLTCQVHPNVKDKWSFDLIMHNRTYHFQAEDENEALVWISVLQNSKDESRSVAYGGDGGTIDSPHQINKHIINEVRSLPGNQVCCDCGAPVNGDGLTPLMLAQNEEESNSKDDEGEKNISTPIKLPPLYSSMGLDIDNKTHETIIFPQREPLPHRSQSPKLIPVPTTNEEWEGFQEAGLQRRSSEPSRYSMDDSTSPLKSRRDGVKSYRKVKGACTALPHSDFLPYGRGLLLGTSSFCHPDSENLTGGINKKRCSQDENQ